MRDNHPIMAEYTEIADIRKVVEKTFMVNGVPVEKANEVWISFNNRFTSRLGDANGDKWRLRFSTPLWPRATIKERYETIVHEACHLVVSYHYRQRVNEVVEKGGSFSKPKPHGGEWKAAMVKAGVRPERCHNVDNTQFRRKQVRYPVYCECMTHMISGQRRGMMLKGRSYMCRCCHTYLRFDKV